MFETLAATPRPAGSAAEAAARGLVRTTIEKAGYVVNDRSFQYSAWPGVWGVPFVGILLIVAAITLAITSSIGRPAVAICCFLLAAALIGSALLQRFGTGSIPWMRRAGINLEATRRGITPAVWLVAHLDSKSQPVPMLLRILAVVTTTLCWISIGVVALMNATLSDTMLTTSASAAFVPLAIAAAICAVPIALCTTEPYSPGALDNASGVATLLATLDHLPASTPIGILITSAEELGLAGARAWLAQNTTHHIPTPVVNFDSIDDHGALVCMVANDPAARLRAAITRVAQSTGTSPQIRRGVAGVLVDAVAFKDAGWPALTLARGTWRTFARIHTRHDTLGAMTGAGIAPAANFAAALVGAIIAVQGNLDA